jgi:hypothetical protein
MSFAADGLDEGTGMLIALFCGVELFGRSQDEEAAPFAVG